MVLENCIDQFALDQRRAEVEQCRDQRHHGQHDRARSVRIHELGNAHHGLASVHAGRTDTVFFWKQSVALHAPQPLHFHVDQQWFAFGELFDTASGLAELGGKGQGIRQDGQELAALRHDFEASATY